MAITFLTSALDGGEWSASLLGRLSRGKSPRYPLDRRLGGPQSRSVRYGKEKILHCRRYLSLILSSCLRLVFRSGVAEKGVK
jgi:hypothetical protein